MKSKKKKKLFCTNQQGLPTPPLGVQRIFLYNKFTEESGMDYSDVDDSSRCVLIIGHLEAIKVRADFDTVWERFPPSDYRQIRSVSLPDFSTKKQLYFTLCHTPILIDGAKLSFALDKETGKKCFTLPARELNIAWKNGPQHWQWLTLPESRVP
ncbi:unnamed protein product [Camellia sinensis]